MLQLFQSIVHIPLSRGHLNCDKTLYHFYFLPQFFD